MEKIVYIVTNTENNNIIGAYDNNLLALIDIMDLIINQLELLRKIVLKLKKILTKDEIDSLINNYKLIHMINNTNVICKQCYFSFDNFTFTDSKNEIIDYLEKFNYPYINKKKHIKFLYENLINISIDDNLTSSSIDVFIPNGTIDTENENEGSIINNASNVLDTDYVNNQINNNIQKQQNINLIKKKIEELEKEKKNELLQCNEIKEKFEKNKNDYIKKKQKNSDLIKKIKNDEDKFELIKRKFYADKTLYFRLKNEIKENEIKENDIGILFKKKYCIFKMLDETNILNTNDELDKYLEYLPDNDDDFIPRDVAYRNMFIKNHTLSGKAKSDIGINSDSDSDTDEYIKEPYNNDNELVNKIDDLFEKT